MVFGLIGNSDAVIKVVIKGIDDFSGVMDTTEKKLKSFQASTKKMGLALTGLGIAGVVGFGKLTKSAINAQETMNKFSVVFKDVSKQGNNAVKDLNKNFGLASITAQQLLGDTGDMLTGFGFAQDAALDLSIQTQKLAVDLASFTNIQGGAERASRILTKGLLGERESMKELGIAILESDVKARLAAKGLENLEGFALKQAKANITLELATEQSKNAIGDFARTADSTANRIRTFQERLKDLKVTIGNEFIPVADNLLNHTTKLLDSFNGLNPATKSFIVQMGGLASATSLAAGGALLLLNALSGTLPILTALASVLGVGVIPMLSIFAASIAGLVVTYKKLNSMSIAWRRTLALSNPIVFAFTEAIIELKDLFLQQTDAARKSAQVIEELGPKYDETTGKVKAFSNETNDLVGRMILASQATENMGGVVQSIQPQLDSTARSVNTLRLASEALARVGIFVGGNLSQGDLAGTASTLATAAARANISSRAALAQSISRDVGLGFARASVDRLSGPTTGALFRQAERNRRTQPFGRQLRAFTPSKAVGQFAPREFAFGGVINGPTLALMGEAGPERVTPLGRGGDGGAGSQVIVNIDSISGVGLTMDALVQEFEQRLRTMISS